jgi:hypothetical protein
MTPPLDLLLDGPAPGSAEASEAPLTLALAHGAGAPMDTAFMTAFARGLAARRTASRCCSRPGAG